MKGFMNCLTIIDEKRKYVTLLLQNCNVTTRKPMLILEQLSFQKITWECWGIL